MCSPPLIRVRILLFSFTHCFGTIAGSCYTSTNAFDSMSIVCREGSVLNQLVETALLLQRAIIFSNTKKHSGQFIHTFTDKA